MKLPDLPEPMYKAIIEQNKSRREDVGTYHVTEVLYCLEKAQLIRAALETKRSDDAIKGISWVLFRGQVFHQALQPLMGGGLPLEHIWTTKQGDEIRMVGEPDWIETDTEGTIIGELKTCKNTAWYEKNGVGPEHLKQVAAYTWMFNEYAKKHPETPKPTLRSAFYYLDMTGIVRIQNLFTQSVLDENMAWLKDRAEKLHIAVKNKDLADLRVDWHSSWECNAAYCPFTEFCHPDYPFEAPPDYPNLEKWYAGPMKVAKKDIAENTISTEAVKAILEEAGVKCSWR